MSGRTYLSIGDVLTLLRQEFPDVTISKIRFLESQGLVDPERTPSGYRKFYDHDVERLRWVLRQQREHFLPLKVIKGRLEEEQGAGDVVAGEGNGQRAAAATAPRSPEPGASPLPATAPEPVLVRRGMGSSRAAVGRELPGFETHPSGGPPRAGSGPQPPARPVLRAAGPTGPRSGAGGSASGTPTPGVARRGTAPGSPPPHEPAPAPAASALSGEGMTVEELAAASGLDVPAVQQLESYGMLRGRAVGGVLYYDEDALEVARLAGGFARYGVEARHLRLHKHTAEREAGFIEQIVLPLLKQRNPESRQRAHEAVADLSRLGQGMREVLLRATLRDQLGG